MRRKDREITDSNVIDTIIKSCDCIRLGFCDNTKPYIVPMNFGFEYENGKRVFYFHGANEGRKKDIISINPYAFFELDTDHEIDEGKEACDCTCFYKCVMGEGNITILTETNEKIRALDSIMKQCSGKDKNEYPQELVENVFIFKIEVESISCKVHKPVI